jgi:hypothetical protein
VSSLVARLVLTESFSTPKVNSLVPLPTPGLLETTLLAAPVLARYVLCEYKIYESDIMKSKAGILTF